MITISRDDVARFAPRPSSATKAATWDAYVAAIVADLPGLCEAYGIDDPLELQHFMAQIGHESGGFTILWESMHYSAPRILEIFGVGRHSAGVRPEEAQRLAGDEQALAERVYGLGNPRKARELGNRDPGDGYRYRGFGPMQTTGRADHERLLRGEHTVTAALRAALAEWDAKRCNELARADDIKTITRRINGGYNGLDDRRRWLARAKRVWPDLVIATPASDPGGNDARRPEFDLDALPPATPSPAQMPAPARVADLVPESRKMRLLERVKLWLGLGTGGTVATMIADAAGAVKGFSNAIRSIPAEYVLVGLGALCVVGLVVVACLQLWILQDHRDGRYVASGSVGGAQS